MAGNPYNWRRIANDYFTFTKGQRRAVIVLITAIVLTIFIPAIYQFFFVSITEKADPMLIEQVTELKVDTGNTYGSYAGREDLNDNSSAAGQLKADENDKRFPLFAFDPNTATTEDWQRLGVRDKTIQTIQKYISKGGHFYKAEDLKKIYGFHENEVARLVPYVRITKADNNNSAKETAGKNSPYDGEQKPSAKSKPIDINLSDTTAFVSLPGIGSKLAARIVNFREKLGGFYKVEQVGETYGVPDSTFQKIKPFLFVTQGSIKKRNLNTASVDALKSPYIPYNVANAIVQYRTHNGTFKSIEDLKKIPLIDEPLYIKIAPYLSID
jgi:competence protein ComEA